MTQSEIDSHLQGMNLAIIRHKLGVESAPDSALWKDAVDALTAGGMSADEISQAYLKKYPA